MKFLKILALIIVLLHECILSINAKCVMYDACSTKSDYDPTTGADPLKVKWNNCKVDMMDARRVEPHSDTARLYKEICPMLYHHDRPNHICCSHNQLVILNNDIQAASAVLDSCPSCYMNFRTFWCYMTCHENQADFVRVSKDVMQPYMNITKILEARKHQKPEDNDSGEDPEGEGEGDEYDDDTENGVDGEEVEAKKDENHSKDESQKNADYHDAEKRDDSDKDYFAEHQRSKRNAHFPKHLAQAVEGKPIASVDEITYYVNEDFFWGLINSCK